jgi:(2Fe-2S) ferredoxin
VLRSKADCLRICTDGPVLLIWPAGVVYGGVTPERIERILREHLLGGCPIPGWIVRDYSLLESSERRSAHDGPHGRIPGGPNGIDRW